MRLFGNLQQQVFELIFIHVLHHFMHGLFLPVVSQHLHHLAVIGDDGVCERGQAAILQVNDPVGNIQDTIVMRHQQDGGAILIGQALHAVNDFPPRLLVE